MIRERPETTRPLAVNLIGPSGEVTAAVTLFDLGV
jgi:hypothetical protein